MAAPVIQLSMRKVMTPFIGSCEHTAACLSDHLEGTLPPREDRRVRRHLRWCKPCNALFDSLARTVERVRLLGADDDVQPTPSVAEAVLQRIRDDARS